MVFAILEFGNTQNSFLRSFARLFFNFLNLAPNLFVTGYFIQQYIFDFQIFQQKVADFIFDSLNNRASDFGTAEFVFCLRFKERILHFYSDSSGDTVTHIRCLIVFSGYIVDRFQDTFAKRALMRAAVSGMLPIDKGIVVLTIFITVSKSKFQRLAFVVDNIIYSVIFNFTGQQIFQSFFAVKTLTVEVNRKPCV